MYMCVTSLFKTFTHEIVGLHHADAPGFLRTFTLTPGLSLSWVFHTSLGHVLHFYMPVTYLFTSFTHEIIYLHHADAPGMSHINMPYSCKYEVHVLGMCGTPKKATSVSGQMSQENPEHLHDVHKSFHGSMSQINMLHTCKNEAQVLGLCGKPKIKQCWCPGKCPKKNCSICMM